MTVATPLPIVSTGEFADRFRITRSNYDGESLRKTWPFMVVDTATRNEYPAESVDKARAIAERIIREERP